MDGVIVRLAWMTRAAGIVGLVAVMAGLGVAGCAVAELGGEPPGENNRPVPPDVTVPDAAPGADVGPDVGPGDGGDDVGRDAAGEGDVGGLDDVGGDTGNDDTGGDDVGGDDTGDATPVPCGGACGPAQFCRDGVCASICAEAEAVCGDVVWEGRTVTCGSCPGAQACESNRCVDVCAQAGAQCGELVWAGSRVQCGTCATGGACQDNTCVHGVGYRRVAAGLNHTCATRSSGQVRCWGADESGQLGNDTLFGGSTQWVDVLGVSNAAHIASHDSHTCVTRTDGQVRCWGLNSFGQLGNNNRTNSGVPAEAMGLTSAVRVAAGRNHTCVLLDTGVLRCWGYNAQGQLGNGQPLSEFSYDKLPVLLPEDGVVAAESGLGHTCALRDDGAVWCWGYSDRGQVGTPGAGAALPVQVTLPAAARGIGVGSKHSCAVLVDGRVFCWGDNAQGQLGNGQTLGGSVPVAVALPAGVRAVAVAAGGAHTCAVDTGRELYCWGDNTHGQLGTGSSATRSTTPVKVSAFNGVLSLSAGGAHTCAVRSVDGQTYCWGDNAHGQLGTGNTTPSRTPVRVQ